MHPVVLGRGFPVGPPAGGQQRPGPGIGRRRGAEPGAHFRTSPMARPPPKPLFRSGIDSALTPPLGLGYITSCVHRKRARVRPPSSVSPGRRPWPAASKSAAAAPAEPVAASCVMQLSIATPLLHAAHEAELMRRT